MCNLEPYKVYAELDQRDDDERAWDDAQELELDPREEYDGWQDVEYENDDDEEVM